MDGPDDVDVLVKYEMLGRQLRARRRGAVRAAFAGFGANPNRDRHDGRQQEQLHRQLIEASAPSVPVPMPRDPMTDFREREQMRIAAQYLRRRSRV
jgi:hypothetical protein